MKTPFSTLAPAILTLAASGSSTVTEINQLRSVDTNIFANSVPSIKKRVERNDTDSDAPAKAKTFVQRYVFQNGMEEGNAKVITLLKIVLQLNDAFEEESKQMENLVGGIIAGSRIDLGSAQLANLFSKDGMSFLVNCQNIVYRSYAIDNLDTLIPKWGKKPWKKAVIFVDNSDADITSDILHFAKSLSRPKTKVVLVANDQPSGNDVTHHERREIISKLKSENGQLMDVDTENLLLRNSGNELVVFGLAIISEELTYLANDVDLVVVKVIAVKVMGHGITAKLYAQTKYKSLKITMEYKRHIVRKGVVGYKPKEPTGQPTVSNTCGLRLSSLCHIHQRKKSEKRVKEKKEIGIVRGKRHHTHSCV
ncbi:hypothetical protein L2E82_25060 [Cichorium intybus]|uniref:Uncharacterized protein n=1 Tax=Cichorium intybus TaxID=13427 RepID=A0ACB9E2M0_CICIN|nr:hypothetical protein L2E82_25060 [Cichorium intybus]